MCVIVSVDSLACIAQIMSTVSTSEPASFDASHATVTNSRRMNQNPQICCILVSKTSGIYQANAPFGSLALELPGSPPAGVLYLDPNVSDIAYD